MAKKKSSGKKTALGKIISDEMHKGHPQDQAIAIAYSKLGESKKGKKKKK